MRIGLRDDFVAAQKHQRSAICNAVFVGDIGLLVGVPIQINHSDGLVISRVRVTQRLDGANPAYDKTITVVDLDWDTYKKTDIANKYGVTDRGSLVFLRGDKVIAQTYSHSSKADLKALFDQAAAAV